MDYPICGHASSLVPVNTPFNFTLSNEQYVKYCSIAVTSYSIPLFDNKLPTPGINGIDLFANRQVACMLVADVPSLWNFLFKNN